MTMTKITLGGVLLAVALAAAPQVKAQHLRAEDYPSKPTRIVVPCRRRGGVHGRA
jgi:tripartite-type tricarboxylate transporter receptor subunit TctC